MLIDSHCHAWARWPYTDRPEPVGSGRIETLIRSLQSCGIDAALVVVAEIGPQSNNLGYVETAARAHPGLLRVLADNDSFWSANYRQPGSAGRLERLLEQHSTVVGISHYPDEDDRDWAQWAISRDGLDLFRYAADRGLIVSLACMPHQLAAVRTIAEHNPSLPILIHHLGMITSSDPHDPDVRELLSCAGFPNIFVKVSGPLVVSSLTTTAVGTAQIVSMLATALGTNRLVWGSDFPVSCSAETYPSTLEAGDLLLAPLGSDARSNIFGGNLARLLRLPATPSAEN